MKIVMKDISLKLMFNIIKNCNDLLFLQRIKIEQVEKLVADLHDKKRMSHTHEKFKRSIIKSWISSEKSAQCH